MSLFRRVSLLTSVLLAGMIVRPASGEQSARKPSLDTLVARVSAYWELMAKGRKDRALQYVQPESKDYFLPGQAPSFSDPHITDLELTPDPTEVWVTVNIKRLLPGIPRPLDCPVKERWVFQGGSWLVVIPKLSAPITAFTGEPRVKPSLNPEETEKKRQSVGEALHFENTRIDFGRVRQGQPVPVALDYRLAGHDAMAWKLRAAPRGLMRSVSGARELTPGEGQKIELEFLTDDYDGEINATFTVQVEHAGVEVPYEFSIRGYVYTPVSVSPRSLRFLKGEFSKEITLTNNSESELAIVSVRTQGSSLDVQPLPQSVAPGAVCRLTVKLTRKDYKTNYSDDLVLRFANPVDEVQSVVLPVIVNYEPIKVWQRAPWEQPVEPRKPAP